jgi:hypothetical protein
MHVVKESHQSDSSDSEFLEISTFLMNAIACCATIKSSVNLSLPDEVLGRYRIARLESRPGNSKESPVAYGALRCLGKASVRLSYSLTRCGQLQGDGSKGRHSCDCRLGLSVTGVRGFVVSIW